MRRAITRVAGGVVLLVAVTGIVFVTGMRAKSPAVVDRVRAVGRATRPLAIKSAGGPGSSASVVHHVGRATGGSYATPVTVVPTDDGFVVALPYGLSSDWLKNVLASGSATIVHDGRTYDVDSPEVVALSSCGHHFSRATNGPTACSAWTSAFGSAVSPSRSSTRQRRAGTPDRRDPT